MPIMILLRHGQSMWNAANLFTGWVDVPLSSQGIQEALEAGKQIADTPIDCIYTSTLMRAQQTAMIAMAQHHSQKVPMMLHEEGSQQQTWSKIYSEQTEQDMIPVHADWHLNERYYGELQGCNKQQTREKYGEEQVKIWRRSFDVPPPEGESLEMTAKRTIPYLNETIIPALQQGNNILVSAHGNSLRSIVMEIEGLSKEAVLQLEIATGVPIFYQYKDGKFHAQ
ncbi:MAG: 2,3-bisphosphoglycerate-dependent phosphoglycerate mutase [Gammaproteobacteria bacterium]|nr:2,3-bisphosphoglycerate-dependent phosphoglycerate mutase [Gammaproteobacteria bacterium]MCH9743790.1 2,3-bisphosphoglycerate-dependent phosphoglycerate mutase [Gammaproteobacteria bacterium]